jgi:cytochrome c553
VVRRFSLSTAVVLATLSAAPAIGQSPDTKARNIAATCANCHGTGGVSVAEIPSLAGRPRAEIVRLMQEFKSGARAATVMNQLAKGYSDEQIEALAGWFAAQKATK